MKTLVWIALALCVFTAAVQAKRKKVNEYFDFAITGEAALYKDLMRRYDYLNPDRAIRPVANVSTTMGVSFGMAIVYFLDYDSDKDMATFSCWDRFMWDDRLLTWEPEKYGNIDHLRIPISKIWKPDMILYNGFDPKTDIDDEVLAVASSDGTVLYIPRVNRQVICDTNSSGIIICSFKFGSWTYDGFKVDVNFYDGVEAVDLTDFSENKDYEVVGNSAVKNTKYYPCCIEPYPDLTFTLEFKRKKSSFWGKKK